MKIISWNVNSLKARTLKNPSNKGGFLIDPKYPKEYD